MTKSELIEAIGNLLDHWEKLSNDCAEYVRTDSPGLAEAFEKLANDEQFKASK